MNAVTVPPPLDAPPSVTGRGASLGPIAPGEMREHADVRLSTGAFLAIRRDPSGEPTFRVIGCSRGAVRFVCAPQPVSREAWAALMGDGGERGPYAEAWVGAIELHFRTDRVTVRTGGREYGFMTVAELRDAMARFAGNH